MDPRNSLKLSSMMTSVIALMVLMSQVGFQNLCFLFLLSLHCFILVFVQSISPFFFSGVAASVDCFGLSITGAMDTAVHQSFYQNACIYSVLWLIGYYFAWKLQLVSSWGFYFSFMQWPSLYLLSQSLLEFSFLKKSPLQSIFVNYICIVNCRHISLPKGTILLSKFRTYSCSIIFFQSQ